MLLNYNTKPHTVTFTHDQICRFRERGWLLRLTAPISLYQIFACLLKGVTLGTPFITAKYDKWLSIGGDCVEKLEQNV